MTADTNVLVRVFVKDEARQAVAAMTLLEEADVVAIPLSSLCELVWVLRRTYGFSKVDVASAVTTLMTVETVATNRPAVEAGIATLTAGGDFADGVIAYEGRFLGGETFVSFDRRAVSLLTQQRHSAQLLG